MKLSVEAAIEWQYRFYERLGCLADDQRATQAQIAIATNEANEWLEFELTGNHPKAQQRILYLEDL